MLWLEEKVRCELDVSTAGMDGVGPLTPSSKGREIQSGLWSGL